MERVEPLFSEIGRLTFQTDVRQATATSARNNPGGGADVGHDATAIIIPVIVTSMR
jgi:hypothetical protein